MKICIECGRELFDHDKLCDKCESKNIISEHEYNLILIELEHTNSFKRKKLLQNHNYRCIYDRLQQPKKEYPMPIILNNIAETTETDEEYWNRINQHTINKPQTKPTIECPYCHSTDTKKISGTSKVVSTAIWGFFSTKRFKEWHCNKCGSDF